MVFLILFSHLWRTWTASIGVRVWTLQPYKYKNKIKIIYCTAVKIGSCEILSDNRRCKHNQVTELTTFLSSSSRYCPWRVGRKLIFRKSSVILSINLKLVQNLECIIFNNINIFNNIQFATKSLNKKVWGASS